MKIKVWNVNLPQHKMKKKDVIWRGFGGHCPELINTSQQIWSGFSPTTVPDNNRQSELSPTMVPQMSTGFENLKHKNPNQMHLSLSWGTLTTPPPPKKFLCRFTLISGMVLGVEKKIWNQIIIWRFSSLTPDFRHESLWRGINILKNWRQQIHWYKWMTLSVPRICDDKT